MKVCFFLRDANDCGGIQQTCSNTMNYLSLHGCEVYSVSLYNALSSSFFLIDESIKQTSLFEKKLSVRGNVLAIRRKLDATLRRICPDVLVVEGVGYVPCLTPEIWKRTKVVVREHSSYDYGTIGGLHWFGKRLSLRKATRIVTLTKSDCLKYRKHVKRDGVILAIPNAFTEIKDIPPYAISSKTLVSCGTLNEVKGFDKAIAAASLVLPKHPGWTWEIYGDGPLRDKLQLQIVELGLQGRVFIMGYRKDKREIFANKSLFVLTSRFEGFGMVLIEAMQFHLPLVSFDVMCGPHEIVTPAVGTLVPSGNVHQLANTIEAMIESTEKRICCSEATACELENYSPFAVGSQWLNLVNSIEG